MKKEHEPTAEERVLSLGKVDERIRQAAISQATEYRCKLVDLKNFLFHCGPLAEALDYKKLSKREIHQYKTLISIYTGLSPD